MKGIKFNNILPHLVAIGLFLALSFSFLSPELSGKVLKQSDIWKHKGISKEIVDYREQTGEQVLWTNALFGGMPSYLISVQYANPVAKTIDKILTLGFKGSKRLLFLYMIGFYILLLVLKVDKWLAIFGAVAFGFSSYHIIILPAGHNAKAHVIGYLPIILSGFLLLFRNRQYMLGLMVSSIAIAGALYANHPQMLYYLFMIMMVMGIFFFVDSFRSKTVGAFAKASGLFILALALGVGTSASRLLTVSEYSKSSTRGKSELHYDQDKDNKTEGLDRDYITSWSYGIGESFSLLVPNFYGGHSGAIGDSEVAMKAVSRENQQSIANSVSSYWGDQPYVAGPVYAGAGIILLALIGFWLIKGPLKFALLGALLLMLFLSWGKNFAGLTNFFIDYFPGYNKFRSVNSMMVGVILLLPLVAILGVDQLIKRKNDIQQNMKPLYMVAGSVFGLLVLMLISPSLFTSFFSDGQYEQLRGQLQGMKLPASRVDSFMADIVSARKALYSADVTRSLLIVGASITVLILFVKDVIKKEILIGLLAFITILDLWQVDRRYLDTTNFVSTKKSENPYKLSKSEKEILKDKELGFRVYNRTARLDSDARTSYFFKSLGGYHGAKMGRYQEMVSKHLSQNVNPHVVNMLNAKYLIVDQGQGKQVIQNPEALGTSWFVDEVKIVGDANEEIEALTSFDPKTTAIIDKRFMDGSGTVAMEHSAEDKIEMIEYNPTHLTYQSTSTAGGFAVFSEIYYQPGWDAYIDGKPADHYRVNYVLRGMNIPAGNHKIEFTFEPKSYATGNTISTASSILLVLLILGTLYTLFKEPKPATD